LEDFFQLYGVELFAVHLVDFSGINYCDFL